MPQRSVPADLRKNATSREPLPASEMEFTGSTAVAMGWAGRKSQDIFCFFAEDALHGSWATESGMNLLRRCIEFIWRDKRSGKEQARDRAFIIALNNLHSLRVTPDGGMSIDPDEIRERVIASRRSLKRFVR